VHRALWVLDPRPLVRAVREWAARERRKKDARV
jgi:hypothetical protein